MSWLDHEREYRGDAWLRKVRKAKLGVFGVGAIGSHLVFSLAKQGFEEVSVFDNDIVEEKNIGTQMYGLHQVGMKKVDALSDYVFNFTDDNVWIWSGDIVKRPNVVKRTTKDFDLSVDCLDNKAARTALIENCNSPLIHAGIGDGFGEVKWDSNYIVPEDAQTDDLCEFPVARNLITIVASLLAESIVQYFMTGERVNFELSFSDIQIDQYRC